MTWMVCDNANPDRRYSLLDRDDFEPEFGPFDSRQAAEAFIVVVGAGLRAGSYMVVDWSRGDCAHPR